MTFISRLEEATRLSDYYASSTPGPSIDWKRALINAAILAGLAFFSTLGGIGAAGLLKDWAQCLLAAGVSAGIAFFARLAIEFGLGPAPVVVVKTE